MIIPEAKLDIDTYQAAEWLNHSKLQTFARGGPRLFYLAHQQRSFPSRPDTAALIFGKQFEDLAFRPDVFGRRCVVKPEGKQADGRTVEGKAWNAAHAHMREEDILHPKTLSHMQEMAAALKENTTAMDLIAACEAQTTYSAPWSTHGLGDLEVASRLDFSCRAGCAESGFVPFQLDLKTTDKLEKFRSGQAVLDYGYHSQGGLGQYCMQQNLSQAAVPRHFLVVVEKPLPHRCEIFEVSGIALDIGFRWCAEQIERIAFHKRSGEWPRVSLEIQEIGIPGWAEHDAMARARAEEDDDEE